MDDTELFTIVTSFRTRSSVHDTKREIDRLLAAGADIDEVSGIDLDSITVLENAIWAREDWLIRFLLDRGANPNVCDLKGRTPLHEIAQLICDPQLFLLFIRKGADVNAIDNEGDTPLFHAAEVGWVVGIKILLAHGAHLHFINENGTTILHKTCSLWLAPVTCLQFLLGLKVLDINKMDNNGNTVLHLALLNDTMNTDTQEAFVVMLTRYGADLTVKNNDGLTVEHIARIFLRKSIEVGDVRWRLDDISPLGDPLRQENDGERSARVMHDFIKNELRLKHERNVAFMMAFHHRLGKHSQISGIERGLGRTILGHDEINNPHLTKKT